MCDRVVTPLGFPAYRVAKTLLVVCVCLLSGVALAAGESNLTLRPGEVKSIPVDQVQRVAIGNPEVVDFTIVSATELLLQAKSIGGTNIILWDRSGQHVINVEVMDRASETVESQLEKLIQELNLPEVRVKRQNDKLFLVGQVARQADLDRLEQLIASFKSGVTNLVAISAPGVVVMPRLVKLSVQVVELNRTDVEKLGVKWSEGIKFTEQSLVEGGVEQGTTGDQLISPTRVIASGTNDPIGSRLGTAFRFGRLSRIGTEFTINALVRKNRARILAEPKLVTASGKEASSNIGLEVPIVTATSTAFQQAGSTVNTNIEFRKTGVILKMTPTLDAKPGSRRITTVMEAELSALDSASALLVPVGNQTVKVPGFRVRNVKTEVTTESGETVMIAGLLEVEDAKNVDQVPALGSMPVIGRFFRSPENSSTQREIVITVTPELLGDQAQDITADRVAAIEQALGTGNLPDPTDTPMRRYATQVQERLAKGIIYPEREEAKGTSGRVMLRLHLLRDGGLEQAVVAESSGVAAFDQAALKAAHDQGPYSPFPPNLNQPDLWLDLPVLFNPLALEQALSMAMSTGGVIHPPPDPASQRYALQVQQRLADGIRYPEREKALGTSGQVTLRLHLDRTGELDQAIVAQSSGISSLDDEALQAAKRQSPYPPFPPEVAQQDLWLDLPVLFNP